MRVPRSQVAAARQRPYFRRPQIGAFSLCDDASTKQSRRFGQMPRKSRPADWRLRPRAESPGRTVPESGLSALVAQPIQPIQSIQSVQLTALESGSELAGLEEAASSSPANSE